MTGRIPKARGLEARKLAPRPAWGSSVALTDGDVLLGEAAQRSEDPVDEDRAEHHLQLYRYASSADHAHLPAWKAFDAAGRKHPGAVGIWHETFAVPASGVETLYGNGAQIGLGAATGTVEVSRRGARARTRLGSRVA